MSLFSSFDKICDTACYLSHQHMSAVSSGFLDWVGRTLLLLHNFIIISFILLASMSQSKLFRRFSDNHIPFNFVWQWRICYCSFVYFQATLNTRRAHILGHNYRRRLKPECMYTTNPVDDKTNYSLEPRKKWVHDFIGWSIWPQYIRINLFIRRIFFIRLFDLNTYIKRRDALIRV